jgi:hypothetical protein
MLQGGDRAGRECLGHLAADGFGGQAEEAALVRRAAAAPTLASAGRSAERSPDVASLSSQARLLGLQRSAGNAAVSRWLTQGTLVRDPGEAVGPIDSLAGSHLLWHGAGQPLDGQVVGQMRAAFGRGFEEVRIHTDTEAGRSAAAVGADAFTLGNDIVFAEGKYRPGFPDGIGLLAHELTHVVQQAGQTRIGDVVLGSPTDETEREAASVSASVLANHHADVRTRARPDSLLCQTRVTEAPPRVAETPAALAAKLRESFRGLGTDEEEVYRVLSFPPSTVRAVRDIYDTRFNDHTRLGLIEDLKDEMSGAELERAMQLIARAGILDVETPQTLAWKVREAFRGPGTDEDEVYRVLRFPPATVRSMINYYNDHLNDHTGLGFVADINDEMSGAERTTALRLLAKAQIDTHTVERVNRISSRVRGDPSKVWAGLIVRGKASPGHAPDVMEQHADVVIPTATGAMETHGYFGNQRGQASSGNVGRSAGLGLPGIGADMAWLLANRPQYVDLAYAKTQGNLSSVILVKVTPSQAMVLRRYWQQLHTDPEAFYFLGHNCSTAAAAGFTVAAVTGEIEGLDTPDHLFGQIKEQYPDAYMISGFYGYTRTGRRYEGMGQSAHLVDPGTGPWQGPFVVERRLR